MNLFYIIFYESELVNCNYYTHGKTFVSDLIQSMISIIGIIMKELTLLVLKSMMFYSNYKLLKTS